MNSRIRVTALDITHVRDHEMQHISDAIRSWGLVPNMHMEPEVYKRFVIGRWLAFSLLKGFRVTRKEFALLAMSSLGKPYVPNHTAAFSISHSHNVVVCAATGFGRIGIDIEQIRPIPVQEYADCFTPSEWQQIVSSDDQHRDALIFWTKKESLLKADGRGLVVPMAHVVVKNDQGNIRHEEKHWYFRRIDLENYICHICFEFLSGDIQLIPATSLLE